MSRKRSTVDLDADVNKLLRAKALERDSSLQEILETLANAYALGDERAIAIVEGE